MRFAAMTQARRASVIAAIGVGLLSVTGCGYITPQETTKIQNVTDGINANVGPLQLRNMVIVSTGENKPGRLIGAVFNSSSQSVTLTVRGATGSETSVPVKANGETLLTEASDPAMLSTTGGQPGSLVQLNFSESGTNQSQDVKIPVLDGTLKEYQQYLPTPSPSGSAKPSSTEKATPGASESATPSPSASS